MCSSVEDMSGDWASNELTAARDTCTRQPELGHWLLALRKFML